MTPAIEQLIKHIDEAHAMEQNVLRMLEGMISTTDDPDILQELEHHKVETEGHALRMRERLEAHGVDAVGGSPAHRHRRSAREAPTRHGARREGRPQRT